MPFGPEYKFRSRYQPRPPAYYYNAFIALAIALAMFAVAAVIIEKAMKEGLSGFLYLGSVGFLIGSAGLFGLLASIGIIESIRKIAYYEYIVSESTIRFATVYEQGKGSLLWDLFVALDLARSLKLRPEYRLSDIVSVEERMQDGMRALLLKETNRQIYNSAYLQVFLPNDDADDIIAELRRRIQNSKVATP